METAALPRREAGAVGLGEELRLPALAKRRAGSPAGRANFVREAPYSRPWQFVKGFQRVLDFANKELEATFNGDQDIATMLADINRETQDAIERSR